MEIRSDHLVRLRARPELHYLSQGRAVLATDADGFFNPGPDRGLFVHETRLVSRYRWLIDGKPPTPVALSAVSQHSWLGYYICKAPGAPPGPRDTGSGQVQEASAQTLELALSRYVGGGMHEDVDLTNYAAHPTRFRLQLVIDADFADLEETRGERRQRGRLRSAWRARPDGGELSFRYSAARTYRRQGGSGVARLQRGLRVLVTKTQPPSRGWRGLTFTVELAPHGTWHACLDFLPEVEQPLLAPGYRCRSFLGSESPYDRLRDAFLRESTAFATRESETLAPVVIGAVEQAKRDLASLRLHDLDEGPRAWTMAAGLPMYVALFGRDTLTVALQAALLGPEMMDGTLRVLARHQGRRVDDWRDEEPGRMLHEAHTGPLSVLQYHPRQRYYGSVTTSGFYPVVVSELWHWTGDKDRIRPLLAPAMAGLRWLDERSDRDRDGFYDYLTRSSQGVQNQAWKDSGDAIVDEDGRVVRPPIATCEEQAFVYVAKLHMAEVLWWLDEKDEAGRLHREAGELKRRFNDRYWMPDAGFYAMALDADRRPIRSIGSNPAHCLAAGIVEKELAAQTARRLLAADLWTGWGIRTLSSAHPAYNPYSYHRGSVWPVEHGSLAIGLMRYGLHAELETLCRGQFELARLSEFYRLPEVVSGHARDDAHPFPALYPQANAPQAWSASAVLSLVQALLGVYPYAPLGVLLVDPWLPEWLPEITLKDLRVGGAKLSVRFFRDEGGRSDYEVLAKEGRVHVVRQPSPWSLTAGFGERLRDAVSSLLPGR